MSLFPPNACVQSMLAQGNEVSKLEWILAHPGQGTREQHLSKSRSRAEKSQVFVLRAGTAQDKDYLNDRCTNTSLCMFSYSVSGGEELHGRRKKGWCFSCWHWSFLQSAQMLINLSLTHWGCQLFAFLLTNISVLSHGITSLRFCLWPDTLKPCAKLCPKESALQCENSLSGQSTHASSVQKYFF